MQVSSYAEANYVSNSKTSNWVAGADIWTDHLTPKDGSTNLGYARNTYGLFLQNTFKPAQWFAVESGLRLEQPFGRRPGLQNARRF